MSEKTLVSEAMADLKKELANLEKEGRKLRISLTTAKRSIKSDQSKKLELSKRVISLTNAENKLNMKKEALEGKISKLKGRLEKIGRISRELEEV